MNARSPERLPDPEAEGALDVLAGTSVVAFGEDLASAICAQHLAALGARVHLLEPEAGCWLRGPDADPAGAPPGSAFACFGRGLLSVSREAALAAPAGVWAAVDVVLEPPPQGAGAVSLPPHARVGESDGPLALSFRESDGSQLTELGAQAAFGLSAFLGRQGDAPYRVGFDLITYSAAVLGVQALLAALPMKQDWGLGQRLRVPFSRVAANLLNNATTASVEPDQQTGFSRSWASAPYLGVPAADGDLEILFYGPGADEGFVRFCERLEAPSIAADPRFRSYGGRTQYAGELREALAPVTVRHPRAAVLELLWSCGAMAVPRWGVGEAVASEQAHANGLVLPHASEAEPWLLASPWSVDGRRARLRALPARGADTASFLALRRPA